MGDRMTINQLLNHISFDLESSVLEVYRNRNGEEVFNSSKLEKSTITLNGVLRKKYVDFFVHKDSKHYGDKEVISVYI